MEQVKTTSEKHSPMFLFIACIFIALLMISNTVASKLIAIGPFIFTGAILVFPVSYIIGDVLTEVYGFKKSRFVIYIGFFALLLMSLVYWFVQILPSASVWPNQGAYDLILGVIPRIVLASLIGYLLGELSNAFVLHKLKSFTKGKYLWMRTTCSTIVGQLVDTSLFVVIGFAGVFPSDILVITILSGYLFKVAYEALATPITYLVVDWLKKEK